MEPGPAGAGGREKHPEAAPEGGRRRLKIPGRGQGGGTDELGKSWRRRVVLRGDRGGGRPAVGGREQVPAFH